MPRPGPNDFQQTGVQTDKKMRWLIAVAVLASAIMELADTSAVNVSLPYIAGNLSSSVDEATRVLTSYLVANAIILPLSGWRFRKTYAIVYLQIFPSTPWRTAELW